MNKAFLAMMVVGVLLALAGLSAVGYVISIAASAPPLDSLKPRDLGSQSEVRAADGTRLGFIQSNELRRPVPLGVVEPGRRDADVRPQCPVSTRHRRAQLLVDGARSE